MAIGETVSAAIGSIFWLYLASLLTVSNYGEIQFVIGIAGFGVGLSLLAHSNTIIVYEIKQRGLRGILFLLTFIMGGVVSVVLFILYSRLDVVFLTFGMICSEMAVGYFVGKKLFVRFSIFYISQKLLMVVLAISLYLLMGIDGIIYGITISYIPLAIVVFTSFKESSFNFSLLKENFGFVFNNYSEKLIVFSRRNLDKMIIMPILGFEILGEFALAIQIYSVMLLFASISFKLLLFNDTVGEDSKKFKIIILLVSTIISILGITIGPKIIPMFFPQFINTVEIIPIVSLAVIPNTIILIFSSKFLGNEKSRFILIGTIIYAIVYLSLIVFLGPIYGIHGLSMSFLIGSVIYSIYLAVMYKIQKLN
jgi:O-antigen/teichoic acid export membrane protein